MDQKALKKLVQTLRELGVTSYDDGQGLKLSLSLNAPVKKAKPPVDSKTVKEIKHKVEEFTSLMKMSDTELVDQLFPDTLPDEVE